MVNFDIIRKVGLVSSNSSNTNIFNLITMFRILLEQLEALRRFSIKYIYKEFILSPLFCIGILFSLYQAVFKKDRASTTIIISVLLFSPIIYTVERMKLRVGQVIILYFFLYLLAANFLINFPRIIKQSALYKSFSFKNKHILLNGGTILFILTCLFSQIFIWPGSGKKNLYALRGEFSFFKDEFRVGGWFNETVQEASEWIKINIPDGSIILCQQYAFTAIDFLTDREYNINMMKRGTTLTPYSITKMPIESMEEPLFIELDTNKRFRIQFENVLLDNINDYRPDYIIITLRQNFLSLYFNNNPNFHLLKSFSNGEIKIFKVNNLPVHPIDDFSTKVDVKIYNYLLSLYKNDSSKYEEIKQLLENILKWSKDDEKKFFYIIESNDKNGFLSNYEHFKERKVY